MTLRPSSFVGKGVPPPAPADFDEMFIRIGRLECEAYYRAERIIVDAWLRERGKRRLIGERAQHVKANEDAKLTRSDVGRILAAVLPMPDGRYISLSTARRAANHLRVVRNGGWVISPLPDGLWRLGLRVVSAAELLEVAKRSGFDPSLTGDE